MVTLFGPSQARTMRAQCPRRGQQRDLDVKGLSSPPATASARSLYLDTSPLLLGPLGVLVTTTPSQLPQSATNKDSRHRHERQQFAKVRWWESLKFSKMHGYFRRTDGAFILSFSYPARIVLTTI